MQERVWLKKKIDKNNSYENLDNYFLYVFYIYMDGAFMDRSSPTTAFDGDIWYFADTM